MRKKSACCVPDPVAHPYDLYVFGPLGSGTVIFSSTDLDPVPDPDPSINKEKD
jgi:hypothetical protein